MLTGEQLLPIDRKLRQVWPRRPGSNHDGISLNVPRCAISRSHRNRLAIPQRSGPLHMFDIPSFKERRNALHKSRHYRVFPCNHPSEVIRDWSLDEQAHIIGFFDLVAEFDDRQKGFTGNAAPIQADTTERVGLNDGDAGAKLGCPDRGDIASGSSAENGDVSLNCHIKKVEA